MKDMIYTGNAILFIARDSQRNLSYLYCDFNSTFARGWSQANINDLELNQFPRHQLEFEAMEFFKKLGIGYYHLGVEELATSDLSLKEVNIQEFKLRFHPLKITAQRLKFVS